MHIFNYQNKPYIIISQNELLFRKLDEDKLHRLILNEIEEICLKRDKTEALCLKITKNQESFFIPIDLLEEPLEEILEILKDELEDIIDNLHLEEEEEEEEVKQEDAEEEKREAHASPKKSFSIFYLLALLFLVLIGVHFFYLPSLENLPKASLKKAYEPKQGWCSANAKLALNKGKDLIEIQHHCGLLGFWTLAKDSTINRRYLELEFSSLKEKDYLNRAKKAYDDTLYKQALIALDKVFYLNAKNAQAYLLLSKTYTKLHKKQKALTSAKNAFILNKSLENTLLLAQLEADNTEYSQAIKHFELALKQKPKQLDVLKKLSSLYWEKGEYSKAQNSFKEIYQHEPLKAQNFINYFESTIVTQTPFDEKLILNFKKQFENQKETLIILDMLNIIKETVNEKETLTQMKKWYQDYDGVKLVFSFDHLFFWLDHAKLEDEKEHTIKKIIGFFIAYQQIYKLENEKL